MIQPVSSTNSHWQVQKWVCVKRELLTFPVTASFLSPYCTIFFSLPIQFTWVWKMRQTLEHLLNFTSPIWFELLDLNQRKRCCSTKRLGFKERRIEGHYYAKQTNRQTRQTGARRLKWYKAVADIKWSQFDREELLFRDLYAKEHHLSTEVPLSQSHFGVLTPPLPTKSWAGLVPGSSSEKTDWLETNCQAREKGRNRSGMRLSDRSLNSEWSLYVATDPGTLTVYLKR